MDCQMPEMDGYEASGRIRRDESSAAHRPVIIAVTANAMQGAEDKCTASGMDGYISKPIDREKLKRVLLRWLPGKSAPDDSVGAEDTEGSAEDHQAIFDWDHLREYTNGDRETEDMIIALFLETMEADVGILKESFSEENFTAWEAAAHKLYGAAIHMGAHRLASICDAAQSLSPEQVGRMKDLHPLILRACQALQEILSNVRRAA